MSVIYRELYKCQSFTENYISCIILSLTKGKPVFWKPFLDNHNRYTYKIQPWFFLIMKDLFEKRYMHFTIIGCILISLVICDKILCDQHTLTWKLTLESLGPMDGSQIVFTLILGRGYFKAETCLYNFRSFTSYSRVKVVTTLKYIIWYPNIVMTFYLFCRLLSYCWTGRNPRSCTKHCCWPSVSTMTRLQRSSSSTRSMKNLKNKRNCITLLNRYLPQWVECFLVLSLIFRLIHCKRK